MRLHKRVYPIRPVVSYVTVLASKASKYVIGIIEDNSNFKAKTVLEIHDLVKSIQVI